MGELVYGIHRNVATYEGDVLTKVAKDVVFGRVIVFLVT